MQTLPAKNKAFPKYLARSFASGLFFLCFVALFTTLLALSGCKVSSEELDYKRAEEASQKNDYESALAHYKAVVAHSVKTPLAIASAKEAAKILQYQLKRPKEAVVYYKHIILYSPDTKDHVEAQKNLANLHFIETLEYAQAIADYSRLLELPHSQKEDLDYRLALARCYFYLNDFFQSQVEIDTILNRSADPNLLFDALLLKANLQLTSKKLDEAIATLNLLIQRYPEKAKAETVGLILAVCYEEQKNFGKAIETLKSIRDTYPRLQFIDQKIKTLRERQGLLPGARGLKK